MKIVFHNWNSQPDVDAAGSAIRRACGNQTFELLDNSWQEEKYEDRDIGLCVFHGTPGGFSEDGLRLNGEWGVRPGMVVCYISTAPLSREILKIESGKTTHWKITIPNTQAAGLISAPTDDLTTAWRKFIEIIQARVSGGSGWSETELEESLKEFLDPSCEALLAFRLLCEAYKFKKIDGKSDCGGIEIHAPEGIEQWLDPFGRKQGADSAATVKAIEEVSSLIGSDEIKNKAKAVLDAANGSGNLDVAIGDFVEEAAKPSA